MYHVESEIPWKDLQEQIRTVPLLGQPDVLPYEDAEINLVGISSPHLDDDTSGYSRSYTPILATSKYVLRQNLDFQDGLTHDLREQGHDQLRLMGGLILRNSETGASSVLIPPIIENTRSDGIYVLDGAHRIWNNREYRMAHPDTLTISGPDIKTLPDGDYDYVRRTISRPAADMIMAVMVTDPSYPGYARPNRWQDIRVLDKVPADPSAKKEYRTDYPGGYRTLYRDFSALGSSGLREP